MPEVLSLKKSNCKNCHKCIRNCPVKSIRFTGQQAHIISDECILCGRCYVVCPHDAKEIMDSTEQVRVLMQSGRRVYASVSPAFVAAFEGSGINALAAALKKIGFAEVEETAVAATLVKREYEKYVEKNGSNVIISSSCPSVNMLIERHYPNLCGYLAPVKSPMLVHALEIKRRDPEAAVVFIGPCIAAKEEAKNSPVDAVLTFAELDLMLRQAKVKVERVMDENSHSRARLFPTVGGIICCMNKPLNGYTYLAVDGADDCRAALDDISNGVIGKCFVELSACEGSCIGGPVMEKYSNFPVRHYQRAVCYAGNEDFDVETPAENEFYENYLPREVRKPMPPEDEIRRILKTIGKNTVEDELNCGTCGYDTCRDKAIAIYRGAADYSMCLPFINDRSQKFTNSILDNSPNGLVVINDSFEIQRINRTAMEMMNITYQADVLGENIIRILDPTPFYQVYESGKTVKNRRAYFSDYKKYFEQTIVRDRESNTLMCIIRDVTEEEEANRKKEEMGHKTAEIADRVVEKQMRIVQEIASLLGETTAETKIALTKLKESIESDENK